MQTASKTWKVWKSGFDRWEKTTSEYLDKALRSPAVLTPSATVLTSLLQGKTAADKFLALCWKSLGIAHRDEHDVALHRINQLESKILDLEEEIRELRGEP